MLGLKEQTMDTQTLLAIAGIIATILFGIWAIAITVRYSRSVCITYLSINRGELYYVNENITFKRPAYW